MNINKSGFYKLSELKTNEIIIEDDLVISLFDDLNQSIDIELGNKSKLNLFGFHESESVKQCKTSKINVKQCKTESELQINYLILGNKKEVLKKEIISDIKASNTKSNVKILSIIMNDGFIDLNGVIKINEGIEKVDGSLVEDNLFLGNTGKIRGIPTLLVRSDDVKASHSCKMERISDEQLFYMRSRGIKKDESMNMMIEAKIFDLFKNLNIINKSFYNELIVKLLEKIK